jgi:hypothetical protein
VRSQNSARDPASGAAGRRRLVVVNAGVNDDGRTIDIHQSERSGDQPDGGQEHLGAELAAGRMDVRQIAKMWSTRIQVTMRAPGGIEMASCRFESRWIALTPFVNVNGVRPTGTAPTTLTRTPLGVSVKVAFATF